MRMQLFELDIERASGRIKAHVVAESEQRATEIVFDHDSAPGEEDLRFTLEHEPPRDCRRLQLLSRRSYYEQDHKQVFTGGSRTGDPHGAGAQTGLSIALGSGGVHFSEDRLLTADTA